jgi:hypothetical protein
MGGMRRAAPASVAAGMHAWTIDVYGWMEKHDISHRNILQRTSILHSSDPGMVIYAKKFEGNQTAFSKRLIK